jgi:fumarylacetoacetase
VSRAIDESHDPGLRSWVESANRPGTDFPIQNLPLGVFRRRSAGEVPRIGVAIGDYVVDLRGCEELGMLEELPQDIREAAKHSQLNGLFGLGAVALSGLRRQVMRILKSDSDRADMNALVPVEAVELQLPVAVGQYTDFYASVFHATNVGTIFRPESPLMPNYKHVPVAYHGRASSIVPSGTPIRRPWGQVKPPDEPRPIFRPTRMLDYELEVGVFIGPGNALGEPVMLDEAEERIVGLCMLNDWSARDVQAWEAQPLGPFLAKNFATTISPWVVTLDALVPFRCPAFQRQTDDPVPLPYLSSEMNARTGGLDLRLEVHLSSERMRAAGTAPLRLTRNYFRQMYWTMGQMVAHHTSNGCNLNPGDLLGSGTVSGSDADSLGCLLEITRQGNRSIQLPSGEERGYLMDGDEVIFHGYCERPGFMRIGFGTCRGVIHSARERPKAW